jgi:carboxylate-amine ligase
MRLRRSIGHMAKSYGLAPIAASTHPFARWAKQRHTDDPRYNAIADDFQGLGRRMIVNGLHVHVGIADNQLRIHLMNELRQYLPMLLALSTSSPFWQGEATGLKSYRTAINDATPRKGIPERFDSWQDYKRATGALVRAGVIEDASKIWWDLRPSVRFPTLEMRITDVSPLIDDAVCVAALFRCLCRCLTRLRQNNEGSPAHALLLINENRWRAERYGMEEGFVDLNGGRIVAFGDVLEDVLELVQEDAAHFDCVAEVQHARVIAARGTSADRQLAHYQLLREQGMSHEASLMGVVDLLIEETVASSSLPRRTDATWKYRPVAAAPSDGG